ncbi:MAG TPA: hypothetical protein VGD50_06470 [Candidatus Baltobacteraceae bacterium]
MTVNETLDKMLAQARELQKNAADAATKTAEQMQPLLKESVKNAQELQTTLSKHAVESSAIASAQTRKAIDSLSAFVKTGSEAMRQSAEQAQAAATKMAEQSREVVESMRAAMEKKPPEQ